ncbi:MAG: 2Fe-2S iron-sulfur cluster binding domain-containing protein, partial [Ilumatobacter sp.]|nr:2Fe-2S iron-sulfur cluster binding domain-containing protein [Ilumatobacter sp.]
MVSFQLNGVGVDVADDGGSLLDALRDRLGIRSAKDGCSPQGQCGCCTVWVDGAPRVACVTPVTRAAGREVTTVEGLDDADGWAAAFCAAGASQCGFCTPGIIMRLAALPPERQQQPAEVERALLAHLCRCTGWRSIVTSCTERATLAAADVGARDPARAKRRARIEGGVAQRVDAAVALGAGGFADDLAPADALVAMRADDGSWAVGENTVEARRLAGKVPGRRTSAPVSWPIELPSAGPAGWARTLQTTWVEPAYLEPDA